MAKNGLIVMPITSGGGRSRASLVARVGYGEDVSQPQQQDASPEAAPAFLLLIEHTHGRGVYRLGLTIKPRVEAVRALICEHRLCEIELYIDEANAKESEDRLSRLRDEKRAGYAERPLAYFASLEWWWATARQAVAAYRDGRVLRISLGDLLDGFSCSGSLDEMRQVERGLTGALDGLAAQMAAGSAFTNGELIIFAPGSRRKKDEADGGTPPSDWRN